jgi:ribosome-binding protein aMBF1 (putative translation factor)
MRCDDCNTKIEGRPMIVPTRTGGVMNLCASCYRFRQPRGLRDDPRWGEPATRQDPRAGLPPRGDGRRL